MPDLSTTQMQLVTSTQFTNRLQYLLAQQAVIVLRELHTIPFHAERANYAMLVIRNPAAAASAAAVFIAGENIGGAVIVGTVVPNANPALTDSSASDTALTAAIVDLWNTLASIDTGA